MGIVDRIKEKCKEKHTNLAALERELSIGNGVIRRWDDRKPGAEQLHKVAICLNTNVEYLLTGKEAEGLTPEEQELVDCYRAANDQGKRAVMTLARSQKQELESYTSGNGLTGTGEL